MERHYGSAQAARLLGVSRNTLLRWFREGRIGGVARDRRGWRSFSEADLQRIRRELGELTEAPTPPEERDRWARMRSYLRRVPIFRGLAEAVLDELAVSARFHGLLRGQALFVPGQRTRGLKILVKGKVRVYRLSGDGREQTLALVTPYQTLGESTLFRQLQQHNSYATCVESSTVLLLPSGRVHQLTAQYPQLASAFLREFCKRIQDLEERLEELALLSLEQRLARVLLERASESGLVDLDLSLTELASWLGAARESLSRSLVRFANDGLIEREGRRIRVLDPEGLGRL